MIDRQKHIRTGGHADIPTFHATLLHTHAATHPLMQTDTHTQHRQQRNTHTHKQINTTCMHLRMLPTLCRQRGNMFFSLRCSISQCRVKPPSEKLKIQAISARSPKNLNCLKPYLDPMKPASLRFLIPVSLYTPSKIR